MHDKTTKPKTVRELNKHQLKYNGGMGKVYSFFCYDIRTEAIKWIKEIKGTGDFAVYFVQEDVLESEDNYHSNSNVIEWIKHFFNITEEDLKNA